METAHNCSLYQTHRPIHVVVFNSWDQYFFTFLDEIILDGTNALYARNVLVEFWVNRHVLCSDCKPFGMLVFVLNVENERYTCWIFRKHFFEELDCKMDTLYDKRLISLVVSIDNFSKLFLNEGALLLVSFES